MSASQSVQEFDKRAESSDTRTSYYKSGALFSSVSAIENAPSDLYFNFLNFLTVSQRRGVDYLPITWQPALESVGTGATADIRQSLINLQLSFAFKRIHLERLTTNSQRNAFRALISEILILGHPTIRAHENIIRLEGVCWEFKKEDVWPVLVFKKSPLGDLKRFMTIDGGKSLNISERLGLCSDVAAALMTMHSFHVIHGDIKPENVLIFANESDGYTARVADFGYSTMALSPEGRVHLPRSPPWNAPEVTDWETTFSFLEAKLTDIYSFAMLCFWILFKDLPQLSETLAALKLAPRAKGNDGLHWLQHLKEERKLRDFARNQIDEIEELDQDQKAGLTSFFQWALADISKERRLDPTKLADAQALYQQQALARDEESSNLDHTPETHSIKGLDFLYLDMEELLQPFGYDPKNMLLDESFSERETLFECSDFRLTKEFPHVIFSDYRLWQHIHQCLKTQALSQIDNMSTRNAAFQLAFCSEIGFCVPQSRTESESWLKRSQKAYGDIESEIQLIKVLKSIQFRSLEVPLDAVKHVQEYRQVGMLQNALLIYKSTSANMERTFGDTHPISVRLEMNIAQLLNGLGRYDEEEAHLLRMKGKYETGLGKEDRSTLTTLARLAGNHNDQGRWEKAEQLGTYLVKTYEQLKGWEDGMSIICRVNLAYTYWLQAKWKEAEGLLVQVLEIRKKLRGQEHPDTLSSMINLASMYDYQGQLHKAAEMKSQVFDLCLKVLGKEHPYTVAAMGNLAANYRLQRRLEETERLEAQVMEIRERLYGREHPITLKSIGNLASTYALQERWDEALKLDEYVMKTSLRVLGEQNPDTVTAMNNAAHTYHDVHRHEEALSLMADVVRLRTKLLGPNHSNTLTSNRNLKKWQNETHESISPVETNQ